MPPKKAVKLPKEKVPADPVIDPTAIPPALPPSVEEAYRRKCVQLKQRTNEVEEENDATRIRLARIRRQIEKMRVERSFLLEQLTRRTSANVEDSDGSPSPPPTVRTACSVSLQLGEPTLISFQPKDKPLRTKRGHRKPSMMAELEASLHKSAASPFISQNLGTMSPSSEAFSHSQAAGGPATSQITNGASKLPKEPASAFELYCEDARLALSKKREENDGDEEQTIEEELEQGWKDLPDADREAFQTKHDELVAEYEKKKEKQEASKAEEAKEKTAEEEKSVEEPAKESAKEDAKEDEEMKDDQKAQPESSATAAHTQETQDEDVEMADNESEAPGEGKSDNKPDSKADGKSDE